MYLCLLTIIAIGLMPCTYDFLSIQTLDFGALLRCSFRCSLNVAAATPRYAPHSRLALHPKYNRLFEKLLLCEKSFSVIVTILLSRSGPLHPLYNRSLVRRDGHRWQSKQFRRSSVSGSWERSWVVRLRWKQNRLVLRPSDTPIYEERVCA